MAKFFSFVRLPKAPKIASALATLILLSSTFTVLAALTSETTLASHTQCTDGSDNDDDGKVDYPQDDDCQSLDDDYEGVGLSGNFLTITDGKESVSPGGSLVYVLTLKQQRENARVVNITLQLPHQSNVVSASDGGGVNGDIIRWTNVSVYKNITRTLTVHVNVSPDVPVGHYLVARALVEGTEATDTTLVENYNPPQSDRYRVSITDGKEYALPGTSLTYTVRIGNTTNQTLTSDVRVAMPYVVNFTSADNGGVRDSYNVTWRSVSLAPGEERTFTFSGVLDQNAPDRYIIHARAYVGTVSDVDETIVRIGLPYAAVTTGITDHRNTAEIGQVLHYTVKVTNDSDVVGTHVNVDAALPLYGEFVSATEGGIFDGSNVRWLLTQVAPHDTRTLTYSVRVRSDAPLDAVLTASAVADGVTGSVSRDTTKVVLQSTEIGQITPDILFRKTADRSEAVPGGSIRYTLFIRNTLDHVISDASILDRYDNKYLSLQSAENKEFLMSSVDGRMEWKVPVLKPGESWQTTYVLSVSADAPTGLSLDNVATLRGSDVSGASLTERVSTNTSGVLGDFPTTGAGMDALLAGALAILALVTAGNQRRLAFGRNFLGL